jgi:hypothetical protein
MSNCQIGWKDIIAPEDILGPNLGSLKGKTTQTKTKHVQGKHINILININSRYRHVAITYNIIFVKRIPFLMTISQHIKFGTTEMIKSN